ncbi:hypothetical protein JXA48_03910 [Candidatus Woesearchaeota archaeon]|nr:hypothetical protein [Candidatus Woesearchaeota archaeon]
MKTKLLQPTDLKEHNLETRLNIIQNTFGISDSEIENIKGERKPHGTKNRVIEAAELTYIALTRQGIEKATALMHITGSLIESLIGTEDNYQISSESINKGINQYFKSERNTLNSEMGIQVNSPTVLRKIVYEEIEKKDMLLNAKETIQIWGPSLQFSDNDLARGIKIPKIGLEQAIMYGIATAGATIENGKEGVHTVYFNYFGEEEKEWMIETIIPIIENSFKVQKDAILRNGNGQDFGTGRNRPLTIHSKVIQQFFSEYLGFSKLIEQRNLINLKKICNNQRDASREEIQQAYLAGLLAKRMPVAKNGKKYQGKITLTKNHILAKEISEYSINEGYYNRLVGKGTQIVFPQDTLYKLSTNTSLDQINIPHKGLLLRKEQYLKLD